MNHNYQNGSYLQYAARENAGELRLAEASYGPGGQGAHVFHTLMDSRFGRILIAATERGVCWIGLHEDGAYLESELRADYPKAMVTRDDAAVYEHGHRVIQYLDSGVLRLSLDIRATAFQASVWRELCAIPFGTTRSYGEIARRIGRPSASRAVGHANGSNPVAIIIPCHRAIGSGGALTGYRWGVEYKRRLLEHEQDLVREAPPLFAS